MDELNFYLDATAAYAEQSNTIFNMFLTVLFGSLAFSAAISLKGIGRDIKIFKLSVSSSSLLIGAALLSFYVISFIFFHGCSIKANILHDAMLAQAKADGISDAVITGLSASIPRPLGLPLSSLGFLVGATLNLMAFMWLANVQRKDKDGV